MGESKGRNGVGFMVKNQKHVEVQDFIGLSERVALIHVKIHEKTFTIIQTYAPTSSSEEKEMDSFYETLGKAIEKSTKHIILLGDLNAKIGLPKQGESRAMGKNGYGKRNKRGERFIHFCLQHNLKIANTMFKKSPKLRWTWMSPNGTTKNEIDYIATNKPQIIEDFSVLSNFKHPSDHRLIRIKINTASNKKKRSNFQTKPNKNINFKKYTEELAKYEEHETKSVQEYYDNIERSILKSTTCAILPQESTRKQTIINDEIIKLKDEKHILRSKENKTKQEKKQLSKLYKVIHRKIKNNTKKYRQKVLRDYLEKAGAVKKAYKYLTKTKPLMSQLQNKSGHLITNRKDLIKVATNFYKSLYKKDSDSTEEAQTNPVNTDNVPKFCTWEIEHSIDKLKHEKSPGPDGITNEMIISGRNTLTKPLTSLFNLILDQKEIPRQWTCSNIVLLFKKGDPKQISNYRPISLMSNLYKLFSATLLRRLTKQIDENQPVEQAGFVSGYSTIDHIHSLKMVMEKYNEYDKALYLCFIDYSKAFDSISHNSIWQALSMQGINKEYIDLIKVIYKNSNSRIMLEKPGNSFKIERGVKQGDPLSPKIFISVLEQIFRAMNWENKGLNLHGKYLSHLRFADDIVLMSEDPFEMQSMLESLFDESKKVGLEVNQTKTKLMTNRHKVPMTISSTNLEYVEEYIYLGHLISFKNCTEKEIERRIKSTWNKYWTLKEIFKSKMPIKIKTKTMETCLLPTLTYACQTWPLTKRNLEKIKVCQRGIERSYMNHRLKDKVKNTTIRSKTKAKDVAIKVLGLKWKWAGHFQRVPDERWTKITTNWYPLNKKRRQGRPQMRWSDDIIKVVGKIWSRAARDRIAWKQMEEAFTALASGPCT